MRYSKKKKITIAIISIICVLFIGFIIYKGISDSMKISDRAEPSKPRTNVLASITKTFKKKSKKTNKTENKVVNKDEKETKNKVVKKEEVVEDDEPDDNLLGTYIITELKIKDRKYTKEEIKKLKEGGYSLELIIKQDGTANLSVLYIDKLLSYTNEYFDDGQNKYNYTKTRNKIKLKIDDTEMVFKKE